MNNTTTAKRSVAPAAASLISATPTGTTATEGLPPLPDQIPTATGTSSTNCPSGDPDWPCKTMADVEEFAKKEEQEAIEKGASSLPAIEDVSEFIVKPLVKPKMLVESILHQGSKMSLGGGSKSFKTWMLIDLGLSVAQGRPWLGFNTTKAKVLYCNFEIQQEFMQDRIKAIEKAKEITSQAGDMDIWNLRGHAAAYNLIIPMILERIKERNYGLIILDPLYKIYGNVDENSASDMADLMNELERLAVKAKAAVVFGAHYSKGNQANKEPIDRVGGSGVYGRDPDSILNFTRHEEEDAFAVEGKLRNLPPMQPFVVKWQYPLMVRDCSLNPKKLKTTISKKPVYTVDDLLKVVAVESRSKKELKEAVVKATGMSESAFNTLFRQFEHTEVHIPSQFGQ